MQKLSIFLSYFGFDCQLPKGQTENSTWSYFIEVFSFFLNNATSIYRLKSHEISLSSFWFTFRFQTFWHTCHAGETWQTCATCRRHMTARPRRALDSRDSRHTWLTVHTIYENVLTPRDNPALAHASQRIRVRSPSGVFLSFRASITGSKIPNDFSTSILDKELSERGGNVRWGEQWEPRVIQ